MKNSKIKICGIKREQDIDYVNMLKPDYIGFVFAKQSRRYITPDMAAMLRKKLLPGITPVGVFVNEYVEKVAGLMLRGIIEIAQFHGQENEDYIAAFRQLTGNPVIQAFRIDRPDDVIRAAQSSADFILLDNGAGGTGTTFDWTLIQNIQRPFFLAGGLNADNVDEAIRLSNPYSVDISSGVETNNIKDYAKMQKFINRVR
ncbi:phosphoribosylanthranilate isomerase [Dehalobacterium formicoaceticum]|uniref:N-(5'-phosphoribosyl)anthranilate isomerase n=1 Tax=Dehalobacterium formicoaceticum TaxID=51515 RepID=A0ABT1Y8Z9_9FIRM|nr:phosphoribosylanthranilate isomerase [Dehalobacterium formicoaceticum]MCR6546961.1 phosphoribosylanthranilate isomerase [Dehalobacterium formicoaceticum]